jgi:chitinase
MFYYPLPCRSYLLSLLFPPLAFLSIVAVAQEVFDPNQPGPERDQFSVAARCPLSCSNDGNWALYKSVDDLSGCDKPILFKLNLYTTIEDQTSSIGIRTCVVDNSSSRLGIRQTFVVPSANSTASVFEDEQHTTEVRIHLRNNSTSDGTVIQETIIALADFLQEEKDSSTTALFAKSGNTIVGVYGGLQIKKKSLSALVRELPKHLPAEGVSQVAAQSCKGDSINTQIFGTFIDTTGDLAATQTALRSWNNATCLLGSWDADTTWKDASVSMIPGSQIAISPYSNNVQNSTLRKRATCSYTQAVDGDGCWAIADRCKVTQAKLA